VARIVRLLEGGHVDGALVSAPHRLVAPRTEVRRLVGTLIALLGGEPIQPDRLVLPVTAKVRESA
jgi:hypothetical protein